MGVTTDLLTLSEAAKRCPALHKQAPKAGPRSKSRPATMRLWRWCRGGVLARNGQKVRLKHYRVGGRIMVTESDLIAFFAATAEAGVEHFRAAPVASPSVEEPARAPDARAPDARAKAAARAEAELRREGF